MSHVAGSQNFQPFDLIQGDDKEDTLLLRALAREARAYLSSFKWAPPIRDFRLAYGVGRIFALFHVTFEGAVEGFPDDELWVVNGDLPPAYFVTESAPTPAEAIEAYCELMEDWADRILAGDDLQGAYPVVAEPTIEHAHMLKSRLEFIREKLIPEASAGPS